MQVLILAKVCRLTRSCEQGLLVPCLHLLEAGVTLQGLTRGEVDVQDFRVDAADHQQKLPILLLRETDCTRRGGLSGDNVGQLLWRLRVRCVVEVDPGLQRALAEQPFSRRAASFCAHRKVVAKARRSTGMPILPLNSENLFQDVLTGRVHRRPPLADRVRTHGSRGGTRSQLGNEYMGLVLRLPTTCDIQVILILLALNVLEVLRIRHVALAVPVWEQAAQVYP
mmetsp:Transcript_34068/g.86195  ORF Transcript_34068/g.86195 Transcript_34068/m.86195 type:complete len:225 (-) Transcript_34068:426-1100(-)